MKRVIIALSMLAFAITAAFAFTFLLTQNIASISEDISHLGSVSQSASNEHITAETRDIIEKWNKTQKILKIITVHENLNTINQNILSLSKISESGNRDLLCEKCRDICIMLSVFVDDEKASAENVF